MHCSKKERREKMVRKYKTEKYSSRKCGGTFIHGSTGSIHSYGFNIYNCELGYTRRACRQTDPNQIGRKIHENVTHSSKTNPVSDDVWINKFGVHQSSDENIPYYCWKDNYGRLHKKKSLTGEVSRNRFVH